MIRDQSQGRDGRGRDTDTAVRFVPFPRSVRRVATQFGFELGAGVDIVRFAVRATNGRRGIRFGGQSPNVTYPVLAELFQKLRVLFTAIAVHGCTVHEWRLSSFFRGSFAVEKDVFGRIRRLS